MDWQPVPKAPYDRSLALAIIDEHGTHILGFPCRRVDDRWVNSKTKKLVDVRVTHWREWRQSLWGDPPPIYVVLDNTPHAIGLGCTADELADALRVPLASVGVRVVRRRKAKTKSPISQFQARGVSRRQYEAKAIKVAQIVDDVSATFQHMPLTASAGS